MKKLLLLCLCFTHSLIALDNDEEIESDQLQKKRVEEGVLFKKREAARVKNEVLFKKREAARLEEKRLNNKRENDEAIRREIENNRLRRQQEDARRNH